MRKLIIMLNNPGDLLMTILACGEINKNDITYYFLTDSENRGILEKFSLNAIYFERRYFQELFYEKSIEPNTEIKDFINHLISYEFNEVINLYQGDESAVLIRLITDGLNCSVKGRYFDYDKTFKIKDIYSQYLYSVAFSRQYNYLHTVEIYKLICNTDMHSVFKWKHCYKKTDDESDFNNIFSLKRGYTVIHVSSAWKSKQFGNSFVSQVANQLSKENTVVLTGSQFDKEKEFEILQMTNKSDKIISLVGKTTLSQLISVIANSNWLITADTVAMHIGAIFSKRIIALFSTTNFLETGPYCEGAYIVKPKVIKEFYGSFDKNCDSQLSSVSPKLVLGLIKGDKNVIKQSQCFVFKTKFQSGKIVYCALNGAKEYLPGDRQQQIFELLSNHNNLSVENDEVNKLDQKTRQLCSVIITVKKSYEVYRDMIMGKLPNSQNKVIDILKIIDENEKELQNKSLNEYCFFHSMFRINVNSVSPFNIIIYLDTIIEQLDVFYYRVIGLSKKK